MRIFTRRVASLFVFGLTAIAVANAQDCTNYDYKGLYSATVLGNFITPPPGVPAGPTARVGRVQVDGKGTASIVTTLSLNGFVLQESYGGTYSIAPDCTASVTLFIPFPGSPSPVPFQFSGMLADAGRVMNLILLNPQGTDVRIMLVKQRKLACNNGDLNGSYVLNETGTVIRGFLANPGPFARVGNIIFDGAGKFSAKVNASYAGVVVPETFAGTYSVNADCSFTAAYAANQASSWFGVLADSSSGANIIESAGGSVITGTLTSVN